MSFNFSFQMVLEYSLNNWWIQVGIFLLTSLLSLYIYTIYFSFNYWKNKGIPYYNGSFPFGSIYDVALMKKSITELFLEFYNKTDKKYIGFYSFFQPQILVKDLDLIKNILVKDFNVFPDRGVYYNEADDPLSAHLFAIEGTRWKNLRNKLSPTFTSGKMKIMYPIIKDCAKELENYGSRIIYKNNKVNFKDITTRFGLDVITTTALGLQGNNFHDDNTDMKNVTDQFAEPSFIQNIRITATVTCKNFAKALRLRFTPKNVQDYFINVVKQNLEYREKNNIKRNDFMQLLIDLKNNEGIVKNGTNEKGKIFCYT